MEDDNEVPPVGGHGDEEENSDGEENVPFDKAKHTNGYAIASELFPDEKDSLDVLGDLDYDFVISDHYWLEVAANSKEGKNKHKITVTSERVDVDDESVSRYTEWTDEVDKLIQKTGPLEGGL